jgi:hypothetical protein
MISRVDLDFRSLESRPELTLAYASGTVVIHYRKEEMELIIRVTEADAIHLMMELREALKDLNTESSGEEY